MIETALMIGWTLMGAALILNVLRMAAGPTLMDRVLAADTIVINVIGLVIMYGISKGTGVYFETALLFAMFGFSSTVAFCRYVTRGDIIE
jgi:multicomponent K+:H+ antiporter subunit F